VEIEFHAAVPRSMICCWPEGSDALLQAVKVTADLTKSNGSLRTGIWLTSPMGWLPWAWKQL